MVTPKSGKLKYETIYEELIMSLFARIALAGALFLASAVGLILEIAAARLIAPYVGMSIYTWTAIIATVLAGMSIGHWIGGRLSESSDEKGLAWIALSFALAAVNTLMIPVLMRATAPGLLASDADIVLAVTSLSAVLFLLPSLFIAASTPILTRIAIDAEPGKSGIVIGRMFALGAGGAILGTLSAGFIFISWIGSHGTLIAVAAICGLLALGFGFWSRQLRLSKAALGIVAIGIGITLTGSGQILASVCDAESRYYCIRVVDFSHETDRDSRLMVLDHMGHGINDQSDPTLLHSSYVDLTDRITSERFSGRKDIHSYFIGGSVHIAPGLGSYLPGR